MWYNIIFNYIEYIALSIKNKKIFINNLLISDIIK